jgi:steroid delta-isomerase-like uncharacterized protein
MADHRELARRTLDAFNTGDVSALGDVFAADHVTHDAQNPFTDLPPLERLRSQVAVYRGAFPDLVMTVDAQYEDGDVVVSRWTATGTQTGELAGLPATGREATVAGIQIDRFDGDRMAEGWGCWDALGMLQQLGAIPAATAG